MFASKNNWTNQDVQILVSYSLTKLLHYSKSGGSCHNLASMELVEKLKLPLRKHKNPYNVQWLSDSGHVKIQHTVTVSFKIGHYEDTIE